MRPYRLAGPVVLALAACSGGQSSEPAQAGTTSDMLNQQDLLQTAASAGVFGTLLGAIKAADLEGTLNGPGPFTLFAPTDDAFAKLTEEERRGLLDDKDKLRSVLAYHIVPGRLSVRDVAAMSSTTTLDGKALDIESSDGVKVNGATVVQPDVMASNGIIHVIDTVLMPKS